MLVWRLTLGTLFVAILAGLCWLDIGAPRPGMYLWPLAICLGLLGASELLAMFRARGQLPNQWVVYGGIAIVLISAGMPIVVTSPPRGASTIQLGWLAIGIAAALLLAAIAALRRYPSSGQATTDLALELFAVLYLGGLIGFLVQLRLLGINFAADRGQLGMLALLSLVLIVKLSDIGQYTVGRCCGRHKLSPRISPGKTWEGVFGGLVFAEIGAVVTWWLSKKLGSEATGIGPVFGGDSVGQVAAAAVYPLALAAAGIVGDLTESLLKRDAGVKDSSTWMPGFGGVLDLLDSLLAAAPVAYVFWTATAIGLSGP